MVDPILKTDGSGVHPDGERDKPTPDAKAATESHPDKTSADNPSPTGFTTTNGQTPGADKDHPTTHTYRYGDMDKKADKEETKSTDGVDSVHDAAVKAVVDMGGTEEQARNNPNFEQRVKDAEKQIRDAIETNKNM